MGIRKLNTLIKQHAPNANLFKNIKEYKNKRFAIDCSILLYKYVYVSKIPNNHIIGFINRTKFYLNNDILPVYVFDGVPPEEKSVTIEKRQDAREKINQKITILEEELKIIENNEEKVRILKQVDKLKSQLIYVNKYHVLECKELLDVMGVPYIQAPGEAEKMCVYLQKNNLVDYVVTDDTDAFPFGGTNVIKTTIGKNNILNEVNLSEILKCFNMTYKQFVDFCILCGCDYATPISYVGEITAYNLIKKHGDLHKIHENSKFNITFDIDKLRSIFLTDDEITKYIEDTNYSFENELILKEVDKIKIEEFCKKYNIRKIF